MIGARNPDRVPWNWTPTDTRDLTASLFSKSFENGIRAEIDFCYVAHTPLNGMYAWHIFYAHKMCLEGRLDGVSGTSA